jgi:hypothetical protein
VLCKFNGLKKFSFIDKEKLKIYKNYPLFTAWTELIEDYEKSIKPSKENKELK